ncbi:MAG: thiamine phosphate synthase [Planctomycetales bacterium]|nr:thiamine phosphate synthase [bacterium]UNM07663.1 MAG: thiamine phosphate synthase [Planctomycetales bacterium]
MNTELKSDWTGSSRLWLVLDHEACAPRDPVTVCKQAIRGGVDAVLCRLRNIDDSAKLDIALKARKVCGIGNVPFVVSHDSELARQTNADGIQFGKADANMQQLSQLAGEGIPWGYSSHAIDEAQEAIAAGASWVFLGPVFVTPEKLKYGDPLGLDTAREAVQNLDESRIVFIGGINQANLAGLVESGARRIAVISAIQRDDEPMLAAQELRLLLSKEG